MVIKPLRLRLRADAGRTVVRPFHLAWQAGGVEVSRTSRLMRRILSLTPEQVDQETEVVTRDFGTRHWQTRKVFEKRFNELASFLAASDFDPESFTPEQRTLIGAYFCHEYSFSAAALMNPSVVPHPDQSGLSDGSVRFVMSLRAVGEGHISSIMFREGIVDQDGYLTLAPEPPFAIAADTDPETQNDADPAVTVFRNADSSLSGTVLFPVTDAQRNGLEDLRLTAFDHGEGEIEYIGTYTAYDGRSIRSELMRTFDFKRFDLAPMTGSAARNKGMALFPRKIGGKYVMMSREDGENLFLVTSDDVTHWDEGTPLFGPAHPWEFIQIGNCGAPIELDEGWLVLTHGVGAMRKYSIGAALLDKDDPSKVLGRTAQPILAAADQDRDGYVPNVVYTCGAMKVGSSLFLPYGVADSSVAFGMVDIQKLLGCLE